MQPLFTGRSGPGICSSKCMEHVPPTCAAGLPTDWPPGVSPPHPMGYTCSLGRSGEGTETREASLELRSGERTKLECTGRTLRGRREGPPPRSAVSCAPGLRGTGVISATSSISHHHLHQHRFSGLRETRHPKIPRRSPHNCTLRVGGGVRGAPPAGTPESGHVLF